MIGINVTLNIFLKKMSSLKVKTRNTTMNTDQYLLKALKTLKISQEFKNN